MRLDKQQALKLRLSGKSYLEIGGILGVPKSTLSGWFSNLVLSSEAQNKILQRARKKSLAGLLKRNANQTNEAIRRALQIRNQATQEVKNISPKELLILGASLYWAEGYKRVVTRNGKVRTFHPVSLTNSDPFLVKAFIKFLREYCGVPIKQIKVNMRIYKHLNENELKRFWKKITGVPDENFRKTYYGISKSSAGVRPYNRLPHGVIQVVVADTKLFHRIMGYIEGIKNLV